MTWNSFSNLCFYSTLLFSAYVLFIPVHGYFPCEPEKQQLDRCRTEFTNYKNQMVSSLTKVFDEQQTCSTLPEQNLRAALERTEKIQKYFIKVYQTPATAKSPAWVPRPAVLAQVGKSLNFSCETPTPHKLRLCIWERKLGTPEAQMIIIDKPFRNGDLTSVHGISYYGDDGLRNGTCGLKIDFVSKEDSHDIWKCTLLVRNGFVFTGQVVVEAEPSIYFTTYEGSIKAYSMASKKVQLIVKGKESARGIAYDALGNRIYWSTFWSYKIQRATVDGQKTETVLCTREYGYFQCLAADWLTGNIYSGTASGVIIACNTTTTNSASKCATDNAMFCTRLLTRGGNIQGMTLNPIQGIMYWTKYESWGGSSIEKAGMDGSRGETIVPGLKQPSGITIDFTESKLYWTDWDRGKMQSYNLTGKVVNPVFNLDTQPLGIAVVGKNIIWGNKGSRKLEMSEKDWKNVSQLHEDNLYIWHLTVVPNVGLPTATIDRIRNSCEGHNCANICVLAPDYHNCSHGLGECILGKCK